MKNQTQVVVLPTEFRTNIKLDPDGFRLWYDSTHMSTEIHTHQHVYITVSQDVEPIKEGDCFIFNNTVARCLKGERWRDCRKIIATTDTKLTKDTWSSIRTSGNYKSREPDIKGIPQVQQSFLKEFVANPDGEFEVEYVAIVVKGTKVALSEPYLKLNQDNTVNISLVKEKVYSRKELLNLTMGNSAIVDWIKENLK